MEMWHSSTFYEINEDQGQERTNSAYRYETHRKNEGNNGAYDGSSDTLSSSDRDSLLRNAVIDGRPSHTIEGGHHQGRNIEMTASLHPYYLGRFVTFPPATLQSERHDLVGLYNSVWRRGTVPGNLACQQDSFFSPSDFEQPRIMLAQAPACRERSLSATQQGKSVKRGKQKRRSSVSTHQEVASRQKCELASTLN
jgi:hypothetical protein